MEDVHRAGGIMAILGELDRAGLIDRSVGPPSAPTLGDALDRWDVTKTQARQGAQLLHAPLPAACRPRSLSARPPLGRARPDREKGVIRDRRARLFQGWRPRRALRQPCRGRLHREDGGRRRLILTFTGPAHVFESQDAAVEGILTNEVKAGDVVLIRYEGPRGGPGMQEMLYPTSYLKSKGLGKACALSPMAASRAARRASPSATSRPKPPKAA
jgi:dihydroxy-acid dehydratase